MLKSFREIKKGRGSIKAIDLEDINRKLYNILCPYCQEVIGVSEYPRSIFHKVFCSSKCLKRFRRSLAESQRSILDGFNMS